MPVAIYAEDCLVFAKAFLELTGLGAARSGPRSLDVLAGREQNMTVEDKNRSTLKGCFWEIAFQDKQPEQSQAGIKYAVLQSANIRHHSYNLVTSLEQGHSQFFEFGEEPGLNSQSVYVSSEGFFYVLYLKPADVGNKRYVTPIWLLQASCQSWSCGIGW